MGASSGGGRIPGGYTPHPGIGNFSKITTPSVKRDRGGSGGSGTPAAPAPPSNGGSRNPPSRTTPLK